jgi:hypothetical protein
MKISSARAAGSNPSTTNALATASRLSRATGYGLPSRTRASGAAMPGGRPPDPP